MNHTGLYMGLVLYDKVMNALRSDHGKGSGETLGDEFRTRIERYIVGITNKMFDLCYLIEFIITDK